MISNVGDPIHPSCGFVEITKPTDTHRIFKITSAEPRSIIPPSVAQLIWGIKPERDVNKDLFFITNRQAKFEEVNKLLMPLPLRQAPIRLPCIDQEEDLVKQAVFRVFAGYAQLGARCFIEEAALNVTIPGFAKPFPGHNYRVAVEQQIGKKNFAKMYDGCEATCLSALAMTEDGKTAHVFTGNTKGTIVDPKEEWVEEDGWDPFFKPDGYNQTLAKLKHFKHIINMRQMPIAEMRSHLREEDNPGVYEVHITVYNCSKEVFEQTHANPLRPSEEHIRRFKDICENLGVKPLVIGMDRPEKPTQLQTAAYHCYKNYSEAQKRVFETAGEFLKAGIPVLRVRLEAMLNNKKGIPTTDDEALKAEHGNYFEFHARIAEYPPEKAEVFKSIIETYHKQNIGTHQQGTVKANFSTVGGGLRFFGNMRAWKVGKETALTEWRSLLKTLEVNGFVIAKEVKPEYCVYDEVPTLDQLTQAI